MPEVHNRPVMETRRKELRHSLTPAEAALWKSLQRSQVAGKKFRRQHSVGDSILDFYCPECRLAVELDGQVHFSSMTSEYDYRRDEYLQKLNICVLRFENCLVFKNLEGVLHMISDHLATPGEETRNDNPAPPVTTPALSAPPLLNQEGSS